MGHWTFGSSGHPWVAQRPAIARKLADAWIASPALKRLVRELGGVFEPRSGLYAWSASVLDTRRGAERHEVARSTWPSEWSRALLVGGTDLGLMDTCAPSLSRYDVTAILGGTASSNRARAIHAAALSADGTRLGKVVVLSADRRLVPLERADSVPGEESESENAARNVRERVGTTPLVLRASAVKSRTRPSTVDTISRFASEFTPPERASVLIVTSAIYAPYQFFRAAPLLLSSGTTYVELVGAPTLSNEPALPQRLGQEIHAAIDAALELLR